MRTLALATTVVLTAVSLTAPAPASGSSRAVIPDIEVRRTVAAPAPGASVAAPSQPYRSDRILVAPAPDAGRRPLARLNTVVGARVQRVLPSTRVREVHLPEHVPVEAALRRYQSSPEVAYAEPDYLISRADSPAVTPDDPGFGDQYALHNTGQTGGTGDADIDAPEAWATVTGDRRRPVVAVIDTGVDVSHPDLRDNLWRNPGEVAGNGVDDDGNGYVDDVHGWDFHHDDASLYDSSADDLHGTHVAGIAAARGNNGTGVTGVAPAAVLMPLKVLGPQGQGSISDAIEALDYAVAHGAMVSNNSWGGAPYSRALHDAIRRAADRGHLFVTAAGNGGSDGVGDDIDIAPEYPASYPDANVVTVAATDHHDRLASFSNRGAESVDLAAPGVGILSTAPGGRYTWLTGTSMAAPHVAGAAALLLDAEPGLTAEGMRSRLTGSVDQRQSLSGKVATGGRLNAHVALHQETIAPQEPTTSEPAPVDSDPTEVKPAPRDTDLTLTASRRRVRVGGRVDFSGALTVEGTALSGQPVVLQRHRLGRHGWRSIEATVTDADGSFTIDGHRPLRNADYRVRYAGDDERSLSGTVSPERRVKVRVRLSLALERRLSVREEQHVTGRVQRRRDGVVRVVVRRGVEVVQRTAADLDRRRRYAVDVRPARPGRYVVRVVRRGDVGNLGARTVKRFRVTREDR